MLHRVSLSLLTTVIALPMATVVQAVPVPESSSPPAVAKMLPANTPGLLLVNASSQAWAELQRFSPVSPLMLASLKLPVPFLPTGINFFSDIQPWLGDHVAIALLPSTNEKETLESNLLMLAPVKDPSQLSGFIDKVKALRGTPNTERDYKGVKILEWAAPPSPDPKPGGKIPPADSGEPPQKAPPTSSPLNFLPQTLLEFSQPFLGSKPAQSLPAANPASEKMGVVLPPEPSPPGPIEVPTPQPSASPEPPSPQKPTSPQKFPEIPPKVPKKLGLAIAVLPGYVVIAPQGQAIEKLVDAQFGGAALAQNPLFQRTLNHAQFGRSLFVGYGDYASFLKLASRIETPATITPFPLRLPPLDDAQVALLTQQYNSFDAFVWLQPEGLRTQTSVYYTTPQPALARQAPLNPNQIFSRLPAATYLSANSRNFKQQWEEFLKVYAEDKPLQEMLKKARSGIRSTTGLDLEKDIVSWMNGEYAFFLFPTSEGLFNYIMPNFNLGVGFILQTSDRPKAEATLKKLEQFATGQNQSQWFSIVTRKIKGQPVVSWEGKDRKRIIRLLSYGWVDNDTLIVTTGLGAMTALNPRPYLPLDRNYTFQTAIQSLPSTSNSFFYINMGSSLSFIYGLIRPFVPEIYSPYVQEGQRILGTIRSISSTNSVAPEARQVDTLWVLSPTKQATSDPPPPTENQPAEKR